MISERTLFILAIVTFNLFGIAVLYLAGIGKLGIYIHPSSQWFVILTGGAFLVLNFFLFVRGRTTDFAKAHLPGMLSLLIVALLLLTLRPVPLSVETAKTRISSGTNSVSTKYGERFSTRKTTDFGIVDWLAAFASPDQSFRFEGAPADITGFYLLQENQPMIGRLVLTCCGADAQPAVIPFRYAGNLPKENTWIRLRGTMHTSDATPVLDVTSLEIISEPKNPYAE